MVTKPKSDKDKLKVKLLELLAGIDFPKKYYEYYKKVCNHNQPNDLDEEDYAAAFKNCLVDVSYNKKESFFTHKETIGTSKLNLKLAFHYSTLELILEFETKHGYIGGVFPGLAMDAAKLNDRKFSYSPSYPKFPFSNMEELEDAIKFSFSLFEEIKQAIQSYNMWND